MSTTSGEADDAHDRKPRTAWVKFYQVKNLSFISPTKGKQYVILYGGCHILFFDPETEEELIFRAVNQENGEGVQCLDVARKSKIFAFAEKCMNPRIMVFSFPDFVCLNTLKAGSMNGYISLAFSEKEYLVSLGSIPEFQITVWNWRTGERLAVKESVIFDKHQLLKCNFGSMFSMSQMPYSSNVLSIWSVHLCHSLCRLLREDISMPFGPGGQMCDSLWSPDGVLYILEIHGDIYSVEGEQHTVSLVIKWDGVRGPNTPCMAWYKNGLIISGPDGTIMHHTVVARRRPSISKGPVATGTGWKLVWIAEPKYAMGALCTADNYGVPDVYGMTVRGELYRLSDNNLTRVKNYGAEIKDFNFINPNADYVATLNVYGNLLIWTRDTGTMVAGMQLGQNCHDMHSSPTAPLLIVGLSVGYVLLVNAQNPLKPIIAGKLHLCCDSIDTVAFTASGKHFLAGARETGHMFVIKSPPTKNVFVMNYIKIQSKIADYTIYEEAELNVRVAFIIQSLTCCGKGGNEIHIYKSRIHNSAEVTKPLSLELALRTGFNYVSIGHNSKMAVQICAIPHRSRHVHVFSLERVLFAADGLPTLQPRLTLALASGHQIRRVELRFSREVMLTWGGDGLVVVRCALTLRPLTAVADHHRTDGGVARARVDPRATGLLSLGCDGALVLTELRADPESDSEAEEAEVEHQKENAKPEAEEENSEEASNENSEENSEEITSPKPDNKAEKEETEGLRQEYILIGSDNEMNWLQSRKDLKDKEEAAKYGNIRKSFQKTLSEIKRQAVALLEANLEGPEEEKLPIGEFDLDEESRQKMIELSNEQITLTVLRINAEIQARDMLTAKIKARTWEQMSVKSKQIHAFLEQFFVENYVLLKPDIELAKQVDKLEERKKFTLNISKSDCFYPWIPKADYKEVCEGPILPDGQKTKQKSIAEIAEEDSISNVESSEHSSPEVFSGSITHRYVEVSPYHASQFELSTFYHAHQEVILLRKITRDLQEFFNLEFEKVNDLKEKELGLQAEKNNRRRHLLSELKIPGILIEDYDWNSYEDSERLMTVQENEVSVTPYLTPSEEELRAQKAREAEALRLALLADDFRERALIVMMHGVLELRWEDKIKKDVPKPKCLLEKPPEEWNEDEIHNVRDYDAKVLNLMDQRRLYRSICGKEYEEIMKNQKESMLKFDKQLEKLLLLKMEIQSCIDQEHLKILRTRLQIYERMRLNKMEKDILDNMAETDRTIYELQSEIHELMETKKLCRQEYEALLTREKNVDKNFKKEFRERSSLVSQLAKLYRRRPKVHQKAQLSGALLDELSHCCVQTDELPTYLPSDSLDFLNALELLDQITHAPHGVTESVWHILCKLRRNKIECELKVKAMALQLAECDSTINVFSKMQIVLRDKMVMFNKDLKDVREEKLETTHNVQVQLVMKQGVTELPDTSDFGNFEDCVLINRGVVEKINSLILDAGDKKLKAMHQVTNFHRVVMCKEWEHKRLRMLIEDLKDKLTYIGSAKLTRDMQNLLKLKADGVFLDSGKELMDRHIAAYKLAYDKTIKVIKDGLEDLNKRLRKSKKENHDLNQSIINLNVDVNELILQRDMTVEEQQDKCRRHRMKLIILRAAAVRKIQQQFHEMLLLQTELELLRLRTYPTLKYNAIQ